METLIWIFYSIGARTAAYRLAARYMPQVHPINFNDEPGAE